MEDLKLLRQMNHLTQKQVADLAGISLRSYKSYENEETKRDSIKYRYLVDLINESAVIDEKTGILDLDTIKEKCSAVFKNYDVEYCILFGSYSKGTATETSDVDLLVSTNERGLRFYALVEDVRNELHKNVDILDVNQLKNNFDLVKEVLKDGKKIYD